MATGSSRWTQSDAAEPRNPYAHEGTGSRAEAVGEALNRARRHGRTAAVEGMAMLQALIEATALITGGRSSEASRLLGPLAKLLEGLGEELALGAAGRSSEVLAAFAAAIDSEIAHWEKRAHDDTEARTVLRAFLGLREVLWEFGVKRESAGAGTKAKKQRSPSRRPRANAAQSGPRVQRVPVQG